jgi:hypothetical protein
MRIALDYDGTYTRDPVLWANFIADCIGRGHEVVCVTMRSSEIPEEQILGVPCEVIYTDRRGKVGHMLNIGRPVAIWIDDDPRLLMTGI